MELYEEKFKNFIAHVEHISNYYPEILPWFEKLKTADLTLFISVAQMEGIFSLAIEYHKNNNILKRNGECCLIIEKFAIQNEFDQHKILEGDIIKLCRYCQLFTVILSAL